VVLVFSHVRHLGVDELPDRRTTLGAPVALEDGGAGGAAAGNPDHRLRRKNLLGRGAIGGIRLNHPLHEVVQRMGVIGVQHEAGRPLQLRALRRAKEIPRIVRHVPEGERLAAGADTKANVPAVSDLRDARIVGNRQAVGVPGNGARFAARQRRDRAQVASAEGLPGRAIVGQEHVAGDLEDDEAEGEDVGGLVILAAQDLAGNVFAVALALNALRSRPGSRQAKVAKLKIAVKGNEDVGGLDIEVNEPSLVNGG